jgi:hypothetical protein
MQASTTPTAPEWVHEMYAQVDAKRVDDYITLFAPDAQLRFASGPTVTGAQAIAATLKRADEGHDMSHTLLNCWEADGTTVLEFEVDYRYQDGREVTFPAITVIERPAGLITSMRVYPAIIP